MTTKVKIEITQSHMPVVIETLRSDGTVAMTRRIVNIGDSGDEYVHSGQTIRVREMTSAEMHAKGEA